MSASSKAAAPRPLARILLLPGLFTLIALAILISLGSWQMQRKTWKEDLIAALDIRLAAAPAPLPPPAEWGALDQTQDEFRRVTFSAQFVKGEEARVYASGSALRADVKAPGYFAFAPARLADGTLIVIDRGYVPDPNPNASTRPLAEPEGPITITGYLRWPEPPGMFSNPHDAKNDLWFVRDHHDMAAKKGWGGAGPFYIDQEAPLPFGGLPRPAALHVGLSNDHLGYALTWFGLAGTLFGVFAAWTIVQFRRKA